MPEQLRPEPSISAKPPPEPLEPLEPRSLKAGMRGFEWLVTAHHLRASPHKYLRRSASIFVNGDARIPRAGRYP